MNGVAVNLSGLQTASMQTIADGSYSFAGLASGGPYTVAPSQSGYAFTPSSIPNLSVNQKTVDFTASPAPTAVTSASTSITSTSATLNGSVNPNGSLTNVWFEWGTDPTLTINTSTTQQAIGAGSDSQAVTGNLSSLVASTTYYFRMVASSAAGTARGSILFFTTVAPPMTIQFSSANYPVGEAGGHVDTIVMRGGDTSGAASVSFASSDQALNQNCNVKNGFASSRCDYEARFATVKFAPGETSKTISVFIDDDSYLEGPDTFNVNLSNPVGASLGTLATATVTIVDNDLVDGTNQIDTSPFFVRLHYLDFLNREPDASGLSFWMNNINNCTPPPSCTESQRINTSAAFYISIEFQQTGYLVERMYKAAYGDAIGTSTTGGAHSLAVPIVRFNEFLSDTQQVGAGVVVNQTGWETVLENNKQAFALEFVGRSSFTTAFQTTLTPAQFVDQLFANAGVTPLAGDRQTAINEFGSATNTSNATARSRALRDVAENAILSSQEFNRAFVLMQYFGYLRRNPNDPPEATLDYNGYEFWLNKLNQFNGNFVAAEMVKAFITSDEYRHRFGP